MAYVMEIDSGYGCLFGGTTRWSDLELALFPWNRQPFTSVPEILDFELSPGPRDEVPNVWLHHLLRDFVCDEKAEELFRTLLKDELHVVARARYGNLRLAVLQVTTILDVVDSKRSIRRKCGKQRVVEFPHVPPDREHLASGHMFRVRQPAPLGLVLAGDDVVDAIKQAGLVGLRFDRAYVTRD